MKKLSEVTAARRTQLGSAAVYLTSKFLGAAIVELSFFAGSKATPEAVTGKINDLLQSKPGNGPVIVEHAQVQTGRRTVVTMLLDLGVKGNNVAPDAKKWGEKISREMQKSKSGDDKIFLQVSSALVSVHSEAVAVKTPKPPKPAKTEAPAPAKK